MGSNIIELGGNGLHTGTRAAGVTILYSEITQMIVDSRWILIAVVLCCLLDFRLGCKESGLHRTEAEKEGNKVMTEFYKFHRSRAVRRSANKFIDYVLLMLVFEAIGAAFLPYVGLRYIYGAWAGGLIACGCELSSAGGHFLYIHGIKVKKRNIKGYLMAFAKALAVAFARQKAGEEVGEAVEEAFTMAESETENKIKTREEKKWNQRKSK